MGRKVAPTYEQLREEYKHLFAECVILPHWTERATIAARCIIDAREQLEEVERITGVPWQVIGVIQGMEAGFVQGDNGIWRLNLKRHMHNGDPLTARTVRVPPGRPAAGTPPFTWVQSAVDAIKLKGLDRVQEWATAKVLYIKEGFNGWGYRWWHPEVLTPYLWSGTNLYKRGKYVEDGKFVASAVSGQIGAAAIMKRLEELGYWLQPINWPDITIPDGEREVVGESATAPGYKPWPEATEVHVEYDKSIKAVDVVDEGSRSMNMFQWLKWKLGTLAFADVAYWFAKYWSDGKDTLHDVLTVIERHAGVIIGGLVFTTLIMVLLGVFFLLEARRSGRYDPRKPVDGDDGIEDRPSPLPPDYLRRARIAADVGTEGSGRGQASGGDEGDHGYADIGAGPMPRDDRRYPVEARDQRVQ